MKRLKLLVVILLVIIIICSLNGKYIAKQYIFPFKHEAVIEKYSSKYQVDPLLVLSIMRAESRFDSSARSHKDAYGLMQITESTGDWIASNMQINNFTIDMLYIEENNIMMGCWYLNDLYKEFNNTDLVIAAYNAGRGNVKGWLSDKRYSSDGKTLDNIPYKETREYLNKVKTYYKIYSKLYGTKR